MNLKQEYQDALTNHKNTWNNFNKCEQEMNDSISYKLKSEELHLEHLLRKLKGKSKKELFDAVPIEKTFLEKILDRLYQTRRINAND